MFMSPDQTPYHFYYSNCPSFYTFITNFFKHLAPKDDTVKAQCNAEKTKHPLKTLVCTSHCAAYGTKN
jgi:hypothetical protein